MAGGVPSRAITLRRYRPDDPRTLADDQAELSEDFRGRRPLRLWPEDLGPTPQSGLQRKQPYQNLGCATQRNLAAMIDNPADLEQPRPESPAHTSRRNIAFENYRKGVATTTSYPEADKAKLSHQANDQPRFSKLRRTSGRHADAGRGIHLARSARLVQAVCASVAVATAVPAASEHRRLGKAHLSVHMGGIAAAIEAYHTAPTPNERHRAGDRARPRHPRRTG